MGHSLLPGSVRGKRQRRSSQLRSHAALHCTAQQGCRQRPKKLAQREASVTVAGSTSISAQHTSLVYSVYYTEYVASSYTETCATHVRVHHASAKPTPHLGNSYASMHWETVSLPMCILGQANSFWNPEVAPTCSAHVVSPSGCSSDTSAVHDRTRAQQLPLQHTINPLSMTVFHRSNSHGNKMCTFPAYLQYGSPQTDMCIRNDHTLPLSSTPTQWCVFCHHVKGLCCCQ